MRRRRGLIIAITIIVVLLAAGGAVAWYVLDDDSPPLPELQDAQAQPGAAGTTPDGTWDGSGGFVGYRIEELFAGETLHKTVVGRTTKVSGALVVRGDTVESASVMADLRALESDREPRDTYLHGNALETNRYPSATFELTGPATLPAAAQPGKVLQVPFRGDLELHGVTRPWTPRSRAVGPGSGSTWSGCCRSSWRTTGSRRRTTRSSPPRTTVRSS